VVADADTGPPALAGVATAIATALPPTLRLGEIADHCRHARELVRQPLGLPPPADNDARLAWGAAMSDAIDRGEEAAAALRVSLVEIARRAENLALAMDFGPLYDKDLRLFHIGYNVTADRLDSHHYDLLASEARLASLFAIAKGDAPLEHWFHLGRAMTLIARRWCLISWGGSMFEYLMPRLLMRSEAGSLLAESEIAAVDAQRRYARTLGVPWGMSESGLSATDRDHTYQYRSFGVPALGLRRGLATETVVAPYASVLALPVDADAAMDNLRQLEALGLVGDYGFYEAADFTPDRTPAGNLFVPVLSYMAHHQGMSLAALHNMLCDEALARHAEADRRLRSVSLLLHERVPTDVPPEATGADAVKPPAPARSRDPRHRAMDSRESGSVSRDASARERPAGVLDLRLGSGNPALAGLEPDAVGGRPDEQTTQASGCTCGTRRPARSRRCRASHVARRRTRSRSCSIHISPNFIGVTVTWPFASRSSSRRADDIEIRHVTVINDGDQARRLTITTCGEVALAKAPDHERHPAFSKLFVHSEFIPQLDGLLFLRQPRRPDERPPVLLHRFVSDDPNVRFRWVSRRIGRRLSGGDERTGIRSGPSDRAPRRPASRSIRFWPCSYRQTSNPARPCGSRSSPPCPDLGNRCSNWPSGIRR
jgi:cyclic beta-1,2-glucan synthetase